MKYVVKYENKFYEFEDALALQAFIWGKRSTEVEVFEKITGDTDPLLDKMRRYVEDAAG